jgi:hypothetical protein
MSDCHKIIQPLKTKKTGILSNIPVGLESINLNIVIFYIRFPWPDRPQPEVSLPVGLSEMPSDLPGARDPHQVPVLLREGGRPGLRSVAGAPLLRQSLLKGSYSEMRSQMHHPVSSRTLSAMSEGNPDEQKNLMSSSR